MRKINKKDGILVFLELLFVSCLLVKKKIEIYKSNEGYKVDINLWEAKWSQ
jgi:hypothetical protein